MKTHKTRVTKNQINRVMEDLTALPAEPVGDHLSDDEFISYSMGTLTVEEGQRVDEHLASCPECAEQMEQLMEASEAWSGAPGEQRLAALRQRVLDKQMLSESLKKILAAQLASVKKFFDVPKPQVAYAKIGTFSEDGETEDGTLRWHIEKEEGNLIASFDSPVLEYEGVQLRLRAGDFQREFVLERVASDQVGAEIVITQEEWGQWPEDVVPSIGLVEKEPRGQSQG